MALLNGSKALEGMDLGNFDQNVGRDIVREAIRQPLKLIAENAGTDGSVVATKVRCAGPAPGGFESVVGEV